jgi:hypothetical protein
MLNIYRNTVLYRGNHGCLIRAAGFINLIPYGLMQFKQRSSVCLTRMALAAIINIHIAANVGCVVSSAPLCP